MESIPSNIKNAIEGRSKKNCLDDPPKLYMSLAFIPGPLAEILNDFVEADPTMHMSSQEYYRILNGLSNFNDWTPDIYWYLWKLLLYVEYHQSVMDMKQYSLVDQKINRSKRRVGEFVVSVPGLHEDRPSLQEKDEIKLLQVNGHNSCTGTITFVGKDYVAVDVTAEFAIHFTPEQKFNIEFRCDTWLANIFNFTLDKLYRYNMAPMFFPYKNPASYNPKKLSIKWINKNIESNREQQQAIKNILNRSSHPAPYILFGPPGTGKTSTLVEAICQIMVRNSSTKILICTSSNSAADEIAERLLKNLSIDNNILFRMYSASRAHTNIKRELKACSNIGDKETVFITKEVFITKKIIITTLSTCIRLHSYQLRADHFSYLFIDEGGQATELETLIPFVLMTGVDSSNEWQFSGQSIIAGDPKQLGPSCQSKLAEPLLQRSMLERLMEWGPYVRNETDHKYDPQYVTKLVQNYRCHDAILHVPNVLFYDKELEAKGGTHTTRAIDWSMLPRKNFPVIFHAVRGKESRIDHSPSVFNQLEINAVINYVKKLLKSVLGGRKVISDDIGIVTPYRLQRSRIHNALCAAHLEPISVGTVETFQGQEKDVIIISTVRTCIYRTDNHFHIGFLSNPKRFNVALTRAKSLLIVIGNPDILQTDPCWREFIEYCFNNKAYRGEKFTLNPTLDNLDIRQCSRTPKSRKYPHSNVSQPVVEDPASSPSYEEKQIQSLKLNRRRRLPIGPLPQETIDSENAIKSSLGEWKYDTYDKKYKEWEENLGSDESDDDDSFDEDKLLGDILGNLHNYGSKESEDYSKSSVSETNCQESSMDFLKNLMIDEENFEADLREKMASLKLS